MSDKILVFVKFKIRGNLRFLSHAETLVMFQRALARADFPVEYTQGFNPHQRLSLPLPRSVGLEVDEDILSVRIKAERLAFDAEDFKARLSAQLPQGCEIISAALAPAVAPLRPVAATYVLQLQQDYPHERLINKIRDTLTKDCITLQRQIDEKGTTRNVDVRPYINAINVKGDLVAVECNIKPAGTIRVDEVLELLELDTTKLAAPVRRVNIEWQGN